MRYSGIVIISLYFVVLFTCVPALAEDGFTQKDRELLIELKVKIGEIDKRFEQIDKRFEQVDKRFEQVDKRFEQVDKRIEELRQDMNKRFEDMFNFLYILSGIFTSLVVVVIGLLFWDRRTIIREARREAIEFIEKEGILRRLIDAFKDLSKEDRRIAEVLRKYNLL
ncbi:MAG: hypothetical protein DRG25_03355 [Deltaproteobacteria bacterium]|nr:MAG: hypothetical protein DRG25_03355 [Deltaproteobacteria bacterium]